MENNYTTPQKTQPKPKTKQTNKKTKPSHQNKSKSKFILWKGYNLLAI